MTDDITDFIRASRETAKRLVPGAAFYVHDLNALGPELRFIVTRALDMLAALQQQLAEQQAEIERITVICERCKMCAEIKGEDR